MTSAIKIAVLITWCIGIVGCDSIRKSQEDSDQWPDSEVGASKRGQTDSTKTGDSTGESIDQSGTPPGEDCRGTQPIALNLPLAETASNGSEGLIRQEDAPVATLEAGGSSYPLRASAPLGILVAGADARSFHRIIYDLASGEVPAGHYQLHVAHPRYVDVDVSIDLAAAACGAHLDLPIFDLALVDPSPNPSVARFALDAGNVFVFTNAEKTAGYLNLTAQAFTGVGISIPGDSTDPNCTPNPGQGCAVAHTAGIPNGTRELGRYTREATGADGAITRTVEIIYGGL